MDDDFSMISSMSVRSSLVTGPTPIPVSGNFFAKNVELKTSITGQNILYSFTELADAIEIISMDPPI